MPIVLDKPSSFFDTFHRKPTQQKTTHYCPGCGHGILHKLIAEAISAAELQDRCIIMAPVGCSVFLYYYFECASISIPHGRAPAVATGISRMRPDAILVCYQGDGDLAAIGTNNAIHAASRGEKIITFFVNNNVYGMTGGQMAPTTLLNQKTTTTPYGRTLENEGAPLPVAEIMATLDAPGLVARTAVNSPRNIQKTRRLIRRGFEAMKDGKGYVFIEVLSHCPTNWRKTPEEACRWIDEVVTKVYPLKLFKDDLDTREPLCREHPRGGFPELVKALGVRAEEQDAGGVPPALPNGTDTLTFKGAGFGGQGVLSLGLLLANTAMRKAWEVTWLPSYGPEMRGGVAYSSVVISRKPIGSPVVDCPDILIALNKPSIFKLGPLVPEQGTIVYNSSMIDELPPDLSAGTVAGVPATDLAAEAGSQKAANTVALGCLAGITGLLTREEIAGALRETYSKPAVYDLNLRALDAGWRHGVRQGTDA
ncbi:MAG: ketoisovalerate oxidoreductase [Kiritimatiellaeota bacterium]|nr:ketoisovalerate oxidoreductase [Kiritimatiellota bacterium]